jgi:hypothetical protein
MNRLLHWLSRRLGAWRPGTRRSAATAAGEALDQQYRREGSELLAARLLRIEQTGHDHEPHA